MTSLTQTSLALYRYMCQHIVGTERTVKTKRVLITAMDGISYNKNAAQITSGSFGEGLELEGSDLDLMIVCKDINIFETYDHNAIDPKVINICMDMDDTQPGFTKLRLINGESDVPSGVCIRKGDALYLSHYIFKERYVDNTFSVIHGPCTSDKNGLLDVATCIHCKLWITPASEWIHRAQNEWPKDHIKLNIVERGVLLVPVGVKGSVNEELEFRISFSVGEKLLIYSFSHTQLLCYALMKILLKDVIETDIRSKNLLCSYFLKTIIFWVSEELPISIWKPANLIHCFLRCFRRLVYCVEYSICPHYFISENNLFETRIEGIKRHILLQNLNILYSYGWRCLLMSERLSMSVVLHIQPNIELLPLQEYIVQIFSSQVLKMISPLSDLNKAIQMIMSQSSGYIRSHLVPVVSKAFFQSVHAFPLNGQKRNKDTYKDYITCISHLLLSSHHDVVSGWLMLSSLFYKMKQYRLALYILSYSLSKFTKDKIFYSEKICNEQIDLIKYYLHLGFPRIIHALGLNMFYFYPKSPLIPDELQTEEKLMPRALPPALFAHFLRFLCFYHLGDVRQYCNSMRDIYRTLSDEYVAGGIVLKAIGYELLGIAFQLTGDRKSARQAFVHAVELDTEFNWSFQRLQMLDTNYRNES